MQTIMRLIQVSQRLNRGSLRSLSRVVDGSIRLLFGASIPGRANIAPDVFFHHSGLGVVINGASIIEGGCEIGVHVVLGGRAPEKGAPHLERGVIVHTGARLIGPIRIGQGAIIAANAVVIGNVPAHTLVAGVPGVVKRQGIDTTRYQSTAYSSSKKRSS